MINYISIFPTKFQVVSVVRRQRLEGFWHVPEEEEGVRSTWTHLPSSWNGYGSIEGYAPLRASYQPA